MIEGVDTAALRKGAATAQIDLLQAVSDAGAKRQSVV